MSQPKDKIIGQVVRALAMDLPDVSDGDLLARYLANRDADAFAALVRRHGPMVRGVCRRILRHEHDAEDAFQATFLVLVRKANTIKPKDVVGNWLYGVAYQTAVRARALAAKRRGRETTSAELAEPIAAIDHQELCDLLPLLDKKLNALPDKYRAPIVLCDLEGKTRKEAAVQLGWPEGTVAGRLARGRAILARRLGQLIGTLSVALAAEAAACVPVPLVEATLRAAAMFAAGSAATVISGPVVALTQGVLQAMFLTKLKTTIAVLLCIGIGGVGTGGLLYRTQAANPQVGDNAIAAQVNPPKAPDPQTGNDPFVAQSKPSTQDANKEYRSNAPAQNTPGIPPPDLSFPSIPGPPTVEELRTKYLKLQDDFSKHLSRDQLQQRAHELEKELAAANEKAQRLAREKSAADDLEKAKAMLLNVAKQHQGTKAALMANRALNVISLPPPSAEGPNTALPPLPGNLPSLPDGNIDVPPSLPPAPSDKKQ
jgi:RNA polymerase sigma factor (sigma-70 family)